MKLHKNDAGWGEGTKEALFAAFYKELEEFNDATNNFLGEVLRKFDMRLEKNDEGEYVYGENKLALAIAAAWKERGITEEDRERFFSIWHEREKVSDENYEFAVGFMKRIKEIYQELLDGKYGTRFTERDLCV